MACTAIGLPTQNIGADKGDAPVTRRNQTLDDLLVMLRHYSEGTRKGARLPSRRAGTADESL